MKAVNPASVTIRLKTIPTNDQLAPLTNSLKIPEKTYTMPCENGLAKIKVTDYLFIYLFPFILHHSVTIIQNRNHTIVQV